MKHKICARVLVLGALVTGGWHAHAGSQLGIFDCMKGLKQVSGHAVSVTSDVVLPDGDNAYILGASRTLRVQNLRPADFGDTFGLVTKDESGEEQVKQVMVDESGGVTPLAAKKGGHPVAAEAVPSDAADLRTALKNELLHQGIDLTPGEKARIMGHCSGVANLRAEMPPEWQGKPDNARQRGESNLDDYLKRAQDMATQKPAKKNSGTVSSGFGDYLTGTPPPHPSRNRPVARPTSNLNDWLKGDSLEAGEMRANR